MAPVFIVDNGGEYSDHSILFVMGPDFATVMAAIDIAKAIRPELHLICIVTSAVWARVEYASVTDLFEAAIYGFDEDSSATVDALRAIPEFEFTSAIQFVDDYNRGLLAKARGL